MHIGIPGLYHQADSVRALSDSGLLGDDLTHVHANSYSAEDMRRVADSGGSLSFSPEVELQMGFGWPPLRRALDAGIRPSLSVDVVTAVGGDLRQQARVLLQVGRALDNAVALQKGEAPGPLQVSTWDALDFATAQGAHALGLNRRIGTLEPGKQADIILVDATAWNMSPLNDAVSQLLLAAHPGNIHTVLIDGQVVKQNGRITVVDESKQQLLRQLGAECAKRLL
jgi:cytosine/adenosine deaminase-related metal-dependent hydrolase